ncbi:hypothetical protein ACHAWO_012289 [Cyclotella atomus]|uniref:Uncharacterized protein n=1 Tax=Cyclotella atomus TaxID=382360 RepID=A0ABD3QBN4_9STRA
MGLRRRMLPKECRKCSQQWHHARKPAICGVSESHSTFLRQKWRGHQGIHHREYQSTHELFRDVSDDTMAFVSCLYSIEYRYTAEQALTRPWLQLRSRKIAAYQRWG